MTALLVLTVSTVRRLHRRMLERARTERGASMLEYALLVCLIAVVCAVVVQVFGHSISSLFTSENSCVAQVPGRTASCS
ncbi:MAG: Flp family type IVb pilin [Acidimicrobiales bacterium]